MRMITAVCLALGAAAVNGLGELIAQRSTKQVPERPALSPRLLLDLLRRRMFLAAIGVTIAGSVLQVLALHLGALALVQPLLVLSLLFVVVIGTVTIRHHAPDLVMLVGAACCAAGTAVFMAVARPHGGVGTIGVGAALPLAVPLTVVVAGCLAAARWGPHAIRPLWLALACGTDFGVNAFLLKIVPDMLPEGFADPLRQWPLYLIVVVIPVGFLLNLNAFQAGAMLAPVLAVITVTDPLISIASGVLWLHEKIATNAPALAGEALSLAVTTVGITALAHRAPHVVRQRDQQEAVQPCSQASHPRRSAGDRARHGQWRSHRATASARHR
jgi:drug/metabolite transporter (DMT)-like permease